MTRLSIVGVAASLTGAAAAANTSTAKRHAVESCTCSCAVGDRHVRIDPCLERLRVRKRRFVRTDPQSMSVPRDCAPRRAFSSRQSGSCWRRDTTPPPSATSPRPAESGARRSTPTSPASRTCCWPSDMTRRRRALVAAEGLRQAVQRIVDRGRRALGRRILRLLGQARVVRPCGIPSGVREPRTAGVECQRRDDGGTHSGAGAVEASRRQDAYQAWIR